LIDRYDWAGGTEAMLRFGPATHPVVVAVLPPFEEANRTRTLLVTVLRRLAEQGIAGALPALPGQGESLLPTEDATLADWRAAFAAAVTALPQPCFSLSVRAGALIDAEAPVTARWSLSPQSGAELRRELQRVRRAAGGPDPAAGEVTEVAGNRISAALWEELAHAETGTIDRIVRLEGDARPADARLPQPPPWRRSEPNCDPALVEALVADITRWVRAWRGA
jgi:hypothetical protein